MDGNRDVSGRIELIDALRGLSMLGIMLVNFPSMNSFVGNEDKAYGGVHTHYDGIFAKLNMIFFNGKFYPIFAVLFGLSTYILFHAAKKKGLDPKIILIRRFIVLFLIGIFHITLIWGGDILFIYAVLGFVLIFFLELQPRTLIYTLMALFLIPWTASSLLEYLNLDYFFGNSMLANNHSDDYFKEIYSHGSFFEITKQRVLDYVRDSTFPKAQITLKAVIDLVGFYADRFACFLLGVYIGKNKWHQNISSLLPTLRKIWGMLLVAVASIAVLQLSFSFPKTGMSLLQDRILAAFYVNSFILLLLKIREHTVFTYFQAVGKMSLSSYLLHTALGTTLLYGYGLGLYGRVGPTILLGVSILTYLATAGICKLWLHYFEFGPVEHVWRMLTYSEVSSFAKKRYLDSESLGVVNKYDKISV